MAQPRSVESEPQARESLAALYRILDRYGMSDLAKKMSVWNVLFQAKLIKQCVLLSR